MLVGSVSMKISRKLGGRGWPATTIGGLNKRDVKFRDSKTSYRFLRTFRSASFLENSKYLEGWTDEEMVVVKES